MGEGQALVYASNVFGDLHWYLHNEPTRREVDRLVAAGWQVIRYDLRGMGSSDRDAIDFSLAARVKDLEAVVDNAQTNRFVLCGYSEGGPTAIAYAVNHPERVSHLALVNTFAQGSAYYRVPAMQAISGMRAMAEEQWELFTQTTATLARGFADPARAKKTAELFRSSSSAQTYLAFSHAAEKVDVVDLLPEIQTPTLVMHASSGYVTEDPSRSLASAIPDARFVRKSDYPAELHSFVRGERLATELEVAHSGTAVILFADIVESTALTERMGDAAFREKARELDTNLRAIIQKASGTTIEGKLLGDGVLAVFTSARQAIEAALGLRPCRRRRRVAVAPRPARRRCDPRGRTTCTAAR